MKHNIYKQFISIILQVCLVGVSVPANAGGNFFLAVPGDTELDFSFVEDDLGNIDENGWQEISNPIEADLVRLACQYYKMGNKRKAAKYFGFAANACYDTGDNEKVVRYGKIVLTLDLKLESKDEYIIKDLSMIANAYFNLQQHAQGLKYILPAIEINRRLLNELLEVEKYVEVGFENILERGRHLTMDLILAARTYLRMGEFPKAIECVLESITIKTELLQKAENEETTEAALTLREHLLEDYVFIADIFSQQDASSRALEYIAKAETLSRELFDLAPYRQKPRTALRYKGLRVKVLSMMAVVYFHENDFDSAFKYIQRAIKLREQLLETAGQGQHLEIKGHLEKDLFLAARICYHREKYIEAKEYILQAIELNRRLRRLTRESGRGNQYLERVALNFGLYGNICFKLGRYNQSAEYLYRAYRFNLVLGNDDDSAKNLGLAANSWSEAGEYVKAALCGEKAVILDENRGDEKAQIKSLLFISINWESAAFKLDLSDELKRRYLQRTYRCFEKYAELCEQREEFVEAVYGMSRAAALCLLLGEYKKTAKLRIKAAELNQKAGNFAWAVKHFIVAASIFRSVKDAEKDVKEAIKTCEQKANDLLENAYQIMLETDDSISGKNRFLLHLNTRYGGILDRATLEYIRLIFTDAGQNKEGETEWSPPGLQGRDSAEAIKISH